MIWLFPMEMREKQRNISDQELLFRIYYCNAYMKEDATCETVASILMADHFLVSTWEVFGDFIVVVVVTVVSWSCCVKRITGET